MYKFCEKCNKEYDLKEKKCPECGTNLIKKYTEEELKEIQKENDDMAVISNTLFI